MSNDIIEREFDRLYALQEKKNAAVKAYKPARTARKALLAQIQPLEAKLREVNVAIKAGIGTVYPIDNEIALVSKALSGKRDPRKPVEPADESEDK